jgi:hypothetical protein
VHAGEPDVDVALAQVLEEAFECLDTGVVHPEHHLAVDHQDPSRRVGGIGVRTTQAAEMEIETPEASGVIFSQGSRFGGHALYVKDGRLKCG